MNVWNDSTREQVDTGQKTEELSTACMPPVRRALINSEVSPKSRRAPVNVQRNIQAGLSSVSESNRPTVEQKLHLIEKNGIIGDFRARLEHMSTPLMDTVSGAAELWQSYCLRVKDLLKYKLYPTADSNPSDVNIEFYDYTHFHPVKIKSTKQSIVHGERVIGESQLILGLLSVSDEDTYFTPSKDYFGNFRWLRTLKTDGALMIQTKEPVERLNNESSGDQDEDLLFPLQDSIVIGSNSLIESQFDFDVLYSMKAFRKEIDLLKNQDNIQRWLSPGLEGSYILNQILSKLSDQIARGDSSEFLDPGKINPNTFSNTVSVKFVDNSQNGDNFGEFEVSYLLGQKSKRDRFRVELNIDTGKFTEAADRSLGLLGIKVLSV